MKVVRLASKTNHGKNRISNHGDLWHISKIENKVSFSSNSGKWGLMISVKDSYSFWMNLENDNDNFIANDMIEYY